MHFLPFVFYVCTHMRILSHVQVYTILININCAFALFSSVYIRIPGGSLLYKLISQIIDYLERLNETEKSNLHYSDGSWDYCPQIILILGILLLTFL